MPDKKKPRVTKKSETIREKTNREADDSKKKPRKIKQATSKASDKASSAKKRSKKEYYLPLPETGFLGQLNKKRSFIPRILKNAWTELRGVTWPNRHETFHLTVAVLLFAMFIGGLIAGMDYVLDNVFRRVVLGL